MKHIILYISVILCLYSCSTRKDRFLNRQYNALTTKYNVLYNGKLAYEKGLSQVQETFVDDYSDLLPIEPFSFYAEQKFGEEVAPIGQESFKRAEEKAVKAIQRHSMFIDGEERNPQTDEAYLLMGKSRYYTKRFGPALEAIEYIIKNYPTATLIYETVILRAKSNIHIGNVAFGKSALKRLLRSPKLLPEDRQQAEIGVVMALEKTPDSLDQIIDHLESGLKALDRGSVASRVAFVLGQAYQKKKMISESDQAFDKVINMKKGLYKFKVQAQLEKINNHIDELSTEEFLDQVNHLIFVTKNRPYIGALLYEKGLIYEAADSIALAKSLYTQSIQSSSRDINQKILSYERLGDLSYNRKNYSEAKSYYDSLVNVSQNKKAKKIISITRKSKNLEKIVGLEEKATENDSLLKIASLDEGALKVLFENHIKKIKEEEKQRRIKELKALAKQNKVTGFENNSDWYFYKANERLKGKKAFAELWNVKVKSKNWYAFSLSRKGIASEKEEGDKEEEKQLKTANKHQVEYYTESINREPKFLDSISKSRNLNYYELGNAYYSQLGEKEFAVDKLEKLIGFNPRKDLKIGAYYRLYKIYNETNEQGEANVYRGKLEQEFPNSSFTKLISNGQGGVRADEDQNADEVCYEYIYSLYLDNSIEEANNELEGAILLYEASTLAPKYALLNAYVKARLKGKEEFYTLLKELKLRYPNTIEAKKAGEILKNKKKTK